MPCMLCQYVQSLVVENQKLKAALKKSRALSTWRLRKIRGLEARIDGDCDRRLPPPRYEAARRGEWYFGEWQSDFQPNPEELETARLAGWQRGIVGIVDGHCPYRHDELKAEWQIGFEMGLAQWQIDRDIRRSERKPADA